MTLLEYVMNEIDGIDDIIDAAILEANINTIITSHSQTHLLNVITMYNRIKKNNVLFVIYINPNQSCNAEDIFLLQGGSPEIMLQKITELEILEYQIITTVPNLRTYIAPKAYIKYSGKC